MEMENEVCQWMAILQDEKNSLHSVQSAWKVLMQYIHLGHQNDKESKKVRHETFQNRKNLKS